MQIAFPGLSVHIVMVALVGAALIVYPGVVPEADSFFVPKLVVLGAAAACACLEFARRSTATLTASLFDLAVFAYFAAGSLALIVHHLPLVNAVAWLGSEGSAALLLFATRAAAANNEYKHRIVNAMVLSALAVAVFALLESRGVALPWEGILRPQSTLGSRNFVGAYLAIALPLAIYRLFERPRWARCAVVTVLATVVLLTRCRSAWLGLMFAFACVSFVWIISPKRGNAAALKRLAISACALSLATALALAVLLPWPGLRWTDKSPLLSSFLRMTEYDRGSGKVRVDQHRIGLSILAEHPMLGVGPGQWDDAAAEHAHAVRGAYIGAWTENPTPQSDLLRATCEIGVLGTLALLFGVVLLTRSSLAHAVSSRAEGGMTIAVLAALAVASVNALLDCPMYRPQTLLVIAVLAGMLPAPAGRWQIRVPAILGRPLAILLGTAMMACSVVRAIPAVEIARAKASPESLQRAQRWFPRAIISQTIAGRLVARGQCDEAIQHAHRSLELSPHRWGALLLAAICAERKGDLQAANEYRTRISQIEPRAAPLRASLQSRK